MKHTVSKVPEHMRPAAANALFPPSAAQMNNVSFRFIDNVLHEPGSKMEGCIAPSGFGKGYLYAMIEAIIRNLREHDVETSKKLIGPKDTRTEAQKCAICDLLRVLLRMFPGATTHGHHEYDKGKACPCFDAKREYSDLIVK